MIHSTNNNPIMRVILDIIKSREPATFYTIERLIPTHPDFVDHETPTAEALQYLEQNGYINRQVASPMSVFSLTREGRSFLEELRRVRAESTAVALIELDASMFARPPHRRYACRARFDGDVNRLPLSMRFLYDSPAWTQWAFVGFMTNHPHGGLLRPNARFQLVEGSQVVGSGVVRFAPALETIEDASGPNFRDRRLESGQPVRAEVA